jgi:hypothetical protein
VLLLAAAAVLLFVQSVRLGSMALLRAQALAGQQQPQRVLGPAAAGQLQRSHQGVSGHGLFLLVLFDSAEGPAV